MVLARTLFFLELTTFSRELANAPCFDATLGGSFSLLFILARPGLLLLSPLVVARLDLVSLLALTMLVLDHSDKLEMVLALTDLFFVELVTASLDRLASPDDPRFSFEDPLAKEERLSWKDDRWLALLRFALLFLIFSRELETDFGGNMFSRLLAYPGSDN